MIRRLPLPRSLSRPLPLPLYRRLHLPALPPPSPPEDFDPLPPSFLNLTPSALSQIVRAQKKANNEDLALRIAVESGGCHGYQYKIEVTDERGEDDYAFQAEEGGKLYVDSSSLALLKGSTIDYATELIGSSFRVLGNPQASDKGGCGCGVSWELKEE